MILCYNPLSELLAGENVKWENAEAAIAIPAETLRVFSFWIFGTLTSDELLDSPATLQIRFADGGMPREMSRIDFGIADMF